jgi:hypothetical protein
MGLFILGLSSSNVSNASDIAVIGWGSLPWDPRELRVEGQPGQQFTADGPALPLAFSRVSKDGRLTLVIDPKTIGAGRKPSTPAGGDAYALYARSMYKFDNRYDYGGENQSGLGCAIQNLREREGSTNKNDIGYVNLMKQTFRMTQLNPLTGEEKTVEGKFSIARGIVDITNGSGIRKELIPYLKGLITWSTIKGFKAAIWTDLQRNFQKKKDYPYSLEAAKTHLRGLTTAKKAKALEYIQKAPVANQLPETNHLLAALQGN